MAEGFRLHLIRHPKPQIDAGICYGQREILAEIELADLRDLQSRLPAELPVWTSPLRRCHDLALALHPVPQLDADLAEIHFGEWEGLAWDDIPRHELDAWAADVVGYAPPGGESPRQLQARARQAIARINVPEAVVVTHGGVIRALLAHWLGLADDAWLTVSADFLSVTTVELDANGRVRRVTKR
ncbi:MAG: histidine phosphatase family protein [Dechloromonas sp.]|nr:histidine phosphatase family protein [Dechloromonas sp.]